MRDVSERSGIRRFLSLAHVKGRLVDRSLPNAQIFSYFVVITAVDNLQLAVLQVSPAQPTPWTPLSVWSSIFVGGIFLFATYHLNGGSAGRDYLARYFSLSAVVALWIAIPFQALITLPRAFDQLAAVEWYVPLVVFLTNVAFFSFIALQVRDVALRSRNALA